MIVDWLRSCYASDFTIDENGPVVIRGEYYWASKGAEIYLEPTFARSAVYLDEWDRSEGIGDTFENYEWKNGSNEVLVYEDLRRTSLAQVGCSKPLFVVDGSHGFPLKCGPIEPSGCALVWSASAYYKPPDPDTVLLPGNVFPYGFTSLGNNTWSLVLTILGNECSWFLSFSRKRWVLELRLRSSTGGPTATARAEGDVKSFTGFPANTTLFPTNGWAVYGGGPPSHVNLFYTI